MFTNKRKIAPFTSQSTEYVTITNKSSETIGFKVKTTAPKFYCVRPNAALVAPGEQVQIQVILLGLNEEPSDDFKCKDKFLVITLPAPYDLGDSSVADTWPQLEAEFKQQAISKKIKVKYLINSTSAPCKVINEKDEKGEKDEEKDEGRDIPKNFVEQPNEGSINMERINPELTQTEPSVSEPSINEAEILDSEKEQYSEKLMESQNNMMNPTAILFVTLIALFLGWLYH